MSRRKAAISLICAVVLIVVGVVLTIGTKNRWCMCITMVGVFIISAFGAMAVESITDQHIESEREYRRKVDELYEMMKTKKGEIDEDISD